jgi:hypothetical protein
LPSPSSMPSLVGLRSNHLLLVGVSTEKPQLDVINSSKGSECLAPGKNPSSSSNGRVSPGAEWSVARGKERGRAQQVDKQQAMGVCQSVSWRNMHMCVHRCSCAAVCSPAFSAVALLLLPFCSLPGPAMCSWLVLAPEPVWRTGVSLLSLAPTPALHSCTHTHSGRSPCRAWRQSMRVRCRASSPPTPWLSNREPSVLLVCMRSSCAGVCV